ncbi:MAG: hypothetical protein U9R50_11810 [Campylobacterota bacterium]|nr:hypothetical protein [Campylobacterota bacterium]
MKITNLYYNHGNIAYVEFTNNGNSKMLSLEHFIGRYGQDILENINAA